MPQNQSRRDLIAHMKLIPLDEMIRNKRLVLIDDSLVRGTQLRGTADFLYGSGAKELHIRLACPPLLFGCPYLNFSRSSSELELIARRKVAALEGKNYETKLDKYTDPDSEEYAAMIVRHYSAKGYGENRIKAELSRRGIARELWEDALVFLPEPDETLQERLRQAEADCYGTPAPQE